MKDYRFKENRHEYFDALYDLNLNQGIMPGLIYLYFPALKHHFGWDAEQALWFAFINGMTQNPLTSLRIYEHLKDFRDEKEVEKFETWFNENWDSLQYDTDRRYQKKETVAAIKHYAYLVDGRGRGSQEKLLTGTYDDLWKLVRGKFVSFGRLSSFSYLEYVKVMGYGAQCTDLMFDDVSGSKSHRNGMFLLMGRDHFVHDKRMKNGFDGKYENFDLQCRVLKHDADFILATSTKHKDAGYFTFESNLCTFKNGFFRRRFPGCYSDMAYDRLKWYEKINGKDKNTELLWSIREQLPVWLRNEAHDDGVSFKQRAALFADTGIPYRAEYFL